MDNTMSNEHSLGQESLPVESLDEAKEAQDIKPGINYNNAPTLIVDPKTQLITVSDPSPTISVFWDRVVQQAVIEASPGPTVASRAYAMIHTAIFDAWAAYDPKAISTQLSDDLQRPSSEITEANKIEAMSYGAYRVLRDLFPDQIEIFENSMLELGFDPHNNTTDITTAAGIGNVSAAALLDFRRQDGSNQLGDNPNGILGVPYSDNSNYQAVNSPDEIVDIERWTPERVPINAEPGEEKRIQQFLTPQWGDIEPFALESGEQFRPEAPEPFLLVDGSVNLEDKTITLEDGFTVKIDKSLIGTIINPEFIAQVEEVVDISANLTDEQKLIAEFWEDGSGTSFPPGTSMTFGQFVSARDNNNLDEDAQLFFSLGNAVFDAGIATWDAKRFYDYTRPVRAVRELGKLGLIGEFSEEKGGFVIDAWQPGQGTQTILATEFLTYQTPGSDPSPPFAEYTSGHSSFSAAGATILELFTGSDEFGASVSFKPGESRFEPDITPSETVILQWDTFSKAADESGISRLYGGIHFTEGDLNGRKLGEEIAQSVWEKTQFFINGGEINGGEVDELINPANAENLTLHNSYFSNSEDIISLDIDRTTLIGNIESSNFGLPSSYPLENPNFVGVFEGSVDILNVGNLEV
ncbi:vanadium-dependent haloperoxidase [Mastigocoleus testarum]|uniref:vanadium-dependent haloperoxidase n=1 Tax=Mastigocoleus testarum TaxID=996925 RepID=UPI00041EE10D|nr:vanadium-dependent haloperoxidase [Mastigocoleus testarum]